MRHPLSRGLTFFSQFNSLAPVNIASPRQPYGVKQNSPTTGVGPYGPYVVSSYSTDSRFLFGGSPSVGNGGDVTAIALVNCTIPSASTSNDVIGNFGDTGVKGWAINASNFSGVAVGMRMILGDGAGNIAGLFTTAGGTGVFGRWAVVAGSFNKTTGTIKNYVDGVLATTEVVSTVYNASTSYSLAVGGRNATGNTADCKIAWAAAFDRCLTDAEVALWSSGRLFQFDSGLDLFLDFSYVECGDTAIATEAMFDPPYAIEISDVQYHEVEVAGTISGGTDPTVVSVGDGVFVAPSPPDANDAPFDTLGDTVISTESASLADTIECGDTTLSRSSIIAQDNPNGGMVIATGRYRR